MSETSDAPVIRQPLPWGIPLQPFLWAAVALALAALPVILGAVAKFRNAVELASAAGSQKFAGATVILDGDGIDGPVTVTALHGRLSGSFPGSVSFRGRKLSLATDFKAARLDVSCAIIEGYREPAGPLTGSYQALR